MRGRRHSLRARFATRSHRAPAEAAPPDGEIPWQRAAKIRILRAPILLGPPLLPTMVIFLITGARPGNAGFVAMLVTLGCWPVAVAALSGLDWLHWLVTRHRVTEAHVEVRTGMVWRTYTSIPRDRVRSVDTTANPLYRAFNLAVVRVGTGESTGSRRSPHGQESELVLDGVTQERAGELRRLLLRRAAEKGRAGAAVAEEDAAGIELARMRRSWLRFAPLTLSLVIIIAGSLLGTLSNVLGDAHRDLGPFLRDAADAVGAIWLLVTLTLIAGLLAGFAGSFLLFVEAWSNFRLLREPGGSLRVVRGLLVSRSVSLGESRLRGAEVAEPLLVRWAGGARVNAVATGLSSREEANKAADRNALLPPAPRAEAQRVAADVAGEPEFATTTLIRHPRAALRRRLVWALTPAVLFVMSLAVLGAVFPWMPWWAWLVAMASLPVAAGFAVDAARSLGHGLTAGHVIARSGTGMRRTVALRRDGIIGWRITQSPFQRRAGIMDVAATTAAGGGAYEIRDASTGEVLGFAGEAVPNLLLPFLENPRTDRSREHRAGSESRGVGAM